MSVPRNDRPAPGHHARAVLYEAGVSGIGETEAAKLPAHEVRRHGVRRLGRDVLMVTGLVITAVAAGTVIGDAIDRSPTQRHFVELQQGKEGGEAEQQSQGPGEDMPAPAAEPHGAVPMEPLVAGDGAARAMANEEASSLGGRPLTEISQP